MSHQLYIANCSKSDFLFTYMLVENPRPFHHKIRAGSQICLSLDQADTEQIVLDQLREMVSFYAELAREQGVPIFNGMPPEQIENDITGRDRLAVDDLRFVDDADDKTGEVVFAVRVH